VIGKLLKGGRWHKETDWFMNTDHGMTSIVLAMSDARFAFDPK